MRLTFCRVLGVIHLKRSQLQFCCLLSLGTKLGPSSTGGETYSTRSFGEQDPKEGIWAHKLGVVRRMVKFTRRRAS